KKIFVYEPFQGYFYNTRYVVLAENGKEVLARTATLNTGLVYVNGGHVGHSTIRPATPGKTMVLTTPASNVLLGVLSKNSSSFISIFKSPGDVTAFELNELYMPDSWVGLMSLDAIVISEPETDLLTPQQKQAVSDYVIAGGMLLILPAPRSDYFKQDFLQFIYPFAAKVNKQSNGTVESFSMDGSKIKGIPAAVSYKVGSGFIIVSKSTLPEFISQSAQGKLAEKYVSKIRDLSDQKLNKASLIKYGEQNPYNAYTGYGSYSRYAMTATDRSVRNLLEHKAATSSLSMFGRKLARLPDISLVVGLSVLYVFILIFSLFYLRAKGKMIVNLFSITGLSVIFMIIVVGMGYAHKGWKTHVQGMDVTFLKNGHDGGILCRSVLFYQPSGTINEFGCKNMIPAIYSSGQPVIIKEGLTYSQSRIDQWSPKDISFIGIKRFGGSISVRFDEKEKKAFVSNLSSAKIEDVICLKNGNTYHCDSSVVQGEVDKELTSTFINYPPGNFPVIADKLKNRSVDEVSANLAANLISYLPSINGTWFDCAILIFSDKNAQIVRSGEQLDYSTRSFAVVKLD
ncbi:MAG: hypothetical protein HY606_15410, partial [Planctomycetes bacterium]|nr:hypothetical protein [Planctomycetota bacterium]